MKRELSVKSVVLVLILLAPGLGSALAQTSLRVSTNWFAQAGHGGYYAAVQDGLYAEHGLEVSVTQGGPQVNNTALIASGQADIVMLSGDQVVNARAQGIPVVAIFAPYQISPQCIMVHAEQPIADFGDLAGRTITVTPGAPYWPFIERTYGIEGQVQVLNYTGQFAEWLLDPMRATQCYAVSEPFVAASEGADPQVKLVYESGFQPYADVMVTTEALLANNPEAVSAFVEASREGFRRFIFNPLGYLEALQRDNPEATAERTLWSIRESLPLMFSDYSLANGFGAMELQRWETLIDQLVELDIIEEGSVSAGALMPRSF